jgi:uncharacterized membrane protein YbhN (UPF0104 family)
MKTIKMLLTFLKKILPWLVAIGIFVYLFSKYPPANIWNSLKSANIMALVGVAVAYFLIMYILDTFSITKILNHFGHESTFKELLPARGLTYLVMVVNYAASQLAFAFYQNRKHKLPISEMLGIFGIIAVIDLFILATLAFLTTFFTQWPFEIGGVNIGTFVRIFTLVAYAGFALNLFFWRAKFIKIGFLEKLRNKDFFSILSRATFNDYLSICVYRIPVHIFIMMGMYFAIKPFHASIPFTNILANIPLIFFIGSLPISPGGLGTTNAATVALLKPFIQSDIITSGVITAGDLLMSFSLAWMFANYIMKALTGAICIKFVSKDLFKPVKNGDKNVAA